MRTCTVKTSPWILAVCSLSAHLDFHVAESFVTNKMRLIICDMTFPAPTCPMGITTSRVPYGCTVTKCKIRVGHVWVPSALHCSNLFGMFRILFDRNTRGLEKLHWMDFWTIKLVADKVLSIVQNNPRSNMFCDKPPDSFAIIS